ncbi:hypothetical protein [Flavobacterium sp. GT3R68]|uniref:hypothetical protein n=1 Tax=Flavobacterium sp. GT3R68 TaxID=2594437 RepID=UPI000F8619A0|nr:hypothetical protein [Flavobacterium sp. GT3R68]RTY94896.1 hypothetical protein EKL32_08200 [Flavobacterium sp. GSN2]TRW91700.1 hypothetical protein FNW07_07375 [Flavobacterium sp. GT3R68]
MKIKSYYLLLLTVISFTSFAQINYEKGYFINNGNLKTECLIKNMDWENTPTEIQYKLAEGSEDVKIGINDVSEFGIGNALRYIRYDIDIDQSSEDLNLLSKERNPVFKNERVFLKQLVAGSANLYLYSGVNKKKYFYSTKDVPTKQLIYKQFFKQVDFNGHLETNNFYRSQLFTDVNCNNAPPKSFDKISYTENSLAKYFQSYNQCKGDKTDALTESSVNKKGMFQFKVIAGINQSSLSIDNLDYYKTTLNFDAKSYPVFGAQIEYILPFNKNKWSVFVESSYSNYKSSGVYTYNSISGPKSETMEIKGRFLDLAAGIRYYMFLNNDSKIFLSLGHNMSIIKFSDLKSQDSDNIDLTFEGTLNRYMFGLGLSHKKLSLEARYYSSQDISDYISRTSSFKNISFILGYKIF